MGDIRRRDFVTLLGGAAAYSVALPLAARAQQPQRMRRIGVLDTLAADDPEASVRHGAFMQGLQELGWAIGRNLRIDTRWAAGDTGRIRNLAAEMVALAPDVIFTSGFSTIRPLLDATTTLPIVFANVVDPVGAGFVTSLARPGGNVTGFASHEFGFPIKWLELLKQIAPGITRAAVLRDPSISAIIGQFAAIQGVAPSFGVELTPIDSRDPDEFQRAFAAFVRGPTDGFIVLGGPSANAQRDLITAMVARHRIPTVYSARYFVTAGGLISYGPDFVDQYRRAAGYVDRILKGEKPANLAVQAPTKYELVINLKTAKALGLTVPDSVLARADEVIE
jgi:putative ABC transport system substrate-binding protein